jgi:hypothetical protein
MEAGWLSARLVFGLGLWSLALALVLVLVSVLVSVLVFGLLYKEPNSLGKRNRVFAP